MSTTVASAFYPAATQLYEIGDTAFVRCVDCIDYPIISTEQDSKFEKIPLDFAKSNKGISFIRQVIYNALILSMSNMADDTINSENLLYHQIPCPNYMYKAVNAEYVPITETYKSV